MTKGDRVKCVISNGRLGSQIIGCLITLSIHLWNCIWKFSKAFILCPFCEGDIHNSYFTYVLHMPLLVVGSCVFDVLNISDF